MRTKHKIVGGLAISLAAMTMVAVPAFATEGYFAQGFGARQKALSGAGVADGNDATSASLNPAGLAKLKRDEFSMSVTAFSPKRKYRQSGITATAPFSSTGTTVESGKNWFAIPNMAYAKRTPNNPYFDVIAFTVYGNGGMNTSYEPVPLPAALGGGTNGVFGTNTRTGINLEQAFISVAVAKQFGNVAVGLAPIIARQQFRAAGLQGFGVPDRQNDVSWGYGLRAGIEWAVMPNLRVGVAGNTRILMQKFDKYATLFAEGGDFDVPASIQAGIAIDVTPNLTFMLDYKHIFYSSVKAISNPSSNIFLLGLATTSQTPNLGAANGAGFGWDDIDIIKVGVEWDATNSLTLRAGYSYNTSPISSQDVSFNILAPATVQHHITAGAEVKLNNNWSLELQGMYAPETSITGPSLFNGKTACLNPKAPSLCNGTDTISMYQMEVTAGIKYKF